MFNVLKADFIVDYFICVAVMDVTRVNILQFVIICDAQLRFKLELIRLNISYVK
jgi:hypothetical protein